jgi:hypothetical protein
VVLHDLALASAFATKKRRLEQSIAFEWLGYSSQILHVLVCLEPLQQLNRRFASLHLRPINSVSDYRFAVDFDDLIPTKRAFEQLYGHARNSFITNNQSGAIDNLDCPVTNFCSLETDFSDLPLRTAHD